LSADGTTATIKVLLLARSLVASAGPTGARYGTGGHVTWDVLVTSVLTPSQYTYRW